MDKLDKLDKLYIRNTIRKAKLYASVKKLHKKRELAQSGKRN